MATSSSQIPSEFSNPNLELLLSEQQIQTRIKELGARITRDYAGLNPLLIGVLKGAFVARGMPSFGDLVTPDELAAIRQYILSRRAALLAGKP